jgi:DNA repair protein RecN (Recombination protein N)
MLKELRIENFAIIQSLELKFEAGLIIFTGETGAGKSIILDAIEALVGGRTDATMVRSGADKAVLEAEFTIPMAFRAEVHGILEREGLDEGAEAVTFGREIRLEGRTIARINGRSVNVGLLKELGSSLVDIHGQSEHLSLLDVKSHLGLLDRYAGAQKEFNTYQQAFQALRQVRKELHSLRELESEAERRMELLEFQAQEIQGANLAPGEEEELSQERSRLANAETLSSSAQQVLTLLDEGSPEAAAVTDLLGQARQLLANLARIDSSQNDLLDQLESASVQISEITRSLGSYLEEIEYNPRRLEQVEDRLELIHRVVKKYGGTVEAALEYGKNARAQLESIAHASERIAELEQQEEAGLAVLKEKAVALSNARKKAAAVMQQQVERQLADLSMAGAKFEVEFQTGEAANGVEIEPGKRIAFSETGIDQVEFFIAPNPGEGLKPLTRIASGGETSRLMLALKNVLTGADFIPTLIFDEIDQGIGGRVGNVVGEKLWRLGRNHQVMCVTHLPQLAAFGDQHFSVRKVVNEGRTTTEVYELKEAARSSELAAMTGSVSEASLKAAREALEAARKVIIEH